MRIEWPDDRCILCFGTPLTDEHVIPSQIGGRLFVKFLCKTCNGRLGHDVEHSVRSDPAIRLAVERLARQMPALARSIREGLPFEAETPIGRLRGRFKRGHYKVDTRKVDGSLVQPTEDARRRIAKDLAGRLPPDEVERWLRAFDEAPLDKPTPLPGVIIIKREGRDTPAPTLDGPMVSHHVLLKIAYEFLAVHLGPAIYNDDPQLAALRHAITTGEETDAFSVEHLTSRTYSPLHGLALFGEPHVVVLVCLFDWLRYRVHLHRIGVRPPNRAYECHLDTGEEAIGIIG